MRFFSLASNMFHLSAEQVQELETQAAADDAVAAYKLGRYLYCVRPQSDSVQRAAVLFMKAKAEGVVEAGVAIAQMWFRGDFGLVDRSKGRHFLMEALEKENEFAAEVYLKKIIYGQDGFEVDLDKAVETLKLLVAQSDNPNFYYLLGLAYERQDNFAEALPWLEKAFEGGVKEATFDLALARSGGFTEDGYFADSDTYLEELAHLGEESEDGFATYLFADYVAGGYDDFDSEEEKAAAHQAIKEAMESALAWGASEAALFLGDAYYNASHGFEQSNKGAFSYYAKGAILGSAECYERMYEMVTAEEVEGYSDGFAASCAIEGARLGSEFLMHQVVGRYKSGQLTDWAAEIEQYYLPVVAAMDDEDLPDDDGRYDAYA